MGNRIVAIDAEIENKVKEMTIAEVYELATLAREFENSSGYEITQVLTYLCNLKNNEHGESNKAVCAKNNVNHQHVIQEMQQRGWLDEDKHLTIKGFREMNNAQGVVNFSIGNDTLVLQNYDGSLYWNTDNTLFEEVWTSVYNTVKEANYNVKLKAYEQPLSADTKKLFKMNGIILEK